VWRSSLADGDSLQNAFKKRRQGSIRQLGHVLVLQSLLHLVGVGHWDHFPPTFSKAFAQDLRITAGIRQVVLTATGQEIQDHVHRVTILTFLHVTDNPGPDGVLPGEMISVNGWRTRGFADALYVLEVFPVAARPFVRVGGLE
jgi:hypothetical protein